MHVGEIAGGKTYAQVSAAAQADPTNVKLQKQTQALFQGQTLRGLLLEAYGFWKMGQIALYAAIASFFLAAVMGRTDSPGLRAPPPGERDRRVPRGTPAKTPELAMA